MLTLLDLPVEMICNIINFCDSITIGSFAYTCSYMHDIANQHYNNECVDGAYRHGVVKYLVPRIIKNPEPIITLDGLHNEVHPRAVAFCLAVYTFENPLHWSLSRGSLAYCTLHRNSHAVIGNALSCMATNKMINAELYAQLLELAKYTNKQLTRCLYDILEADKMHEASVLYIELLKRMDKQYIKTSLSHLLPIKSLKFPYPLDLLQWIHDHVGLFGGYERKIWIGFFILCALHAKVAVMKFLHEQLVFTSIELMPHLSVLLRYHTPDKTSSCLHAIHSIVLLDEQTLRHIFTVTRGALAFRWITVELTKGNYSLN